MTKDMTAARALLDTGNYTCAVCRGARAYTATERGVRPLVTWLEQGLNLEGFCAADRVVGRATAFLYCLLGVSQVYARVMSRPAAQVLQAADIAFDADVFTDGIINRQGTGPCPFEAAVMAIDDPRQAQEAIVQKLRAMTKAGI